MARVREGWGSDVSVVYVEGEPGNGTNADVAEVLRVARKWLRSSGPQNRDVGAITFFWDSDGDDNLVPTLHLYMERY